MIQHFDTLAYVKKSRELGVPEPVAEYQAKQIEKVLDMAVNNMREEIHAKELATKRDLNDVKVELKSDIRDVELKLEQMKNQMILWMISIMSAYAAFFLGIIAKGFHWW